MCFGCLFRLFRFQISQAILNYTGGAFIFVKRELGGRIRSAEVVEPRSGSKFQKRLKGTCIFWLL
jgi:hypothetical protein